MSGCRRKFAGRISIFASVITLVTIKRLAVFASGQGSNLANIHEEILSGKLRDVELVLILSNNSASGALEYGRLKGVPSVHFSVVTCGTDEAGYAEAMLSLLEEHRVDLIMLAGYLKKLPQSVVERYSNRILNVHPALLPAFGGVAMYGNKVHEAVLARGCRVSGATVHLVTSEYDEGPIVVQKCCPVYATDTVEELRDRVGELEFEIVPIAIDHAVHGTLRVEGNRVYITE